MDNIPELIDLLESMRNNIEISLHLIHSAKYSLLPTPLEQILVQAQEVVDDYCVIKEDGNAL